MANRPAGGPENTETPDENPTPDPREPRDLPSFTSVASFFEVPLTREGPVVIKRSDLEAELGVSSAQRGLSTGDSPISDLDQFPYLQFMLEVASLIESGEVRTHPKSKLVGWLETHWPEESLGGKSANKIRLMATLLRRPDDAKGGNTKWKLQ